MKFKQIEIEAIVCGLLHLGTFYGSQIQNTEFRVEDLIKKVNALSGKKSPAEQAKKEHPMSTHYGHGHKD